MGGSICRVKRVRLGAAQLFVGARNSNDCSFSDVTTKPIYGIVEQNRSSDRLRFTLLNRLSWNASTWQMLNLGNAVGLALVVAQRCWSHMHLQQGETK